MTALADIQAKAYSLIIQIKNGEFAKIQIPARTAKNIKWDPESKQYILGSQFEEKSLANVKHLRSIQHLAYVMTVAKHLIEQKRTSTLRDIYYLAQAYDILFKNQNESNYAISELETLLNYPREYYNIHPEERGSIFGDLTIEYTTPDYEGKQVNLTSHPDGFVIGPALSTAHFVETSADKVIVIEKDAMTTRLIEERAWKKFNAILINTSGQAPRGVRFLIRRLNEELNLPVFIFTDGDSYGMSIAQVIISGSIRSAHLRGLVTPNAKWRGVYASDIIKHKLPTIPMNKMDIKKLIEIKKDPRYQGELWQKEIDLFLKLKKKCELQAFSRYGLRYIVDKYLVEKIENAN